MDLKLKTQKLQEMLNKSAKGVGNNKLIPLTSLMAIEVKDGILRIVTTDATNYLYVVDKVDKDAEFYAVVSADVFCKLIGRMTCENITLQVGLNSLKVTGNGTYNIELPLDENGLPVKFPDPAATFEATGEESYWSKSDIDIILGSVKPAIATTLEVPCYTGYYIGDSVVATDISKIADFNINLLDQNMLISQEMMNLLSIFDDEEIKVLHNANSIMFTSHSVSVYGQRMVGIEDFAIDAITELVDKEYASSCKVKKSTLLQVLDRLSLFVSPYDKNGIYLHFTNEGIEIYSKSSKALEFIPYLESFNSMEFTCLIDIEMLVSEIKAIRGEVANIEYGEDNAIKIIEDKITIVVALLDDNS